MVGVTVIICCYNSAKRLPKTLAHLAGQRVKPNVKWEVVVVNNDSKDNTRETAINEWATHQSTISLRVVDQPLAGLTNARKKGVEVSLFDTLIFCDDDNWLFPNYVQKSFELAQQLPNAGAIGGEGIATSDAKLPDWFEKYKTYYACYPQGTHNGEISGVISFLYGAGLIIKKENFHNLESKGFESMITDRIGLSLISGGDNELCYALKLRGFKLYYSAELKFYHYVPASRLTKDYLLKLIEAVSYSSMKLVLFHYAIQEKKVNRLSWLKDFFYRLYCLVRDFFKSFKENDPFSRTVIRTSSYNSFKAVIDLYGNYRKKYKQLLALKR
jgi:glycosyltransferase involved in cell wall biosynthesis